MIDRKKLKEEESSGRAAEPTKLRIQKSGAHISKTLIDVILTNQPRLFIHSGVHDPLRSDHALVFGFMPERLATFGAKVRSFHSVNYECRESGRISQFFCVQC